MTARTALIDGAVGVVVAPSGRLMLVLVVTIANGKITGVDVVADPERLGSRNWRCWTEQPADKIRQTKNRIPAPAGTVGESVVNLSTVRPRASGDSALRESMFQLGSNSTTALNPKSPLAVCSRARAKHPAWPSAFGTAASRPARSREPSPSASNDGCLHAAASPVRLQVPTGNSWQPP